MAELEEISRLDVDLHKEPSVIYASRHNTLAIVLDLLTFGTDAYRSAFIIQNFDTFKAIHAPHKRKGDFYKQLMENYLWDMIKICTCFENYMKASLLQHGDIVHWITRLPHLKALRDEQRIRPVTRWELQELDKGTLQPDQKIKLKIPIDILTINFSTMLQEKYVVAHGLPDRHVQFVKSCNDIRNRLHLLDSKKIDFSDKTIEHFEDLTSFVYVNMQMFYDEIEAMFKKEFPNSPIQQNGIIYLKQKESNG